MNVALDDKLVEEAKALGGHRSKRAAIQEALLEYIQRRQRHELVELFGKLDWDPEYDYKAERRAR